jgi:hypothetical protein
MTPAWLEVRWPDGAREVHPIPSPLPSLLRIERRGPPPLEKGLRQKSDSSSGTGMSGMKPDNAMWSPIVLTSQP